MYGTIRTHARSTSSQLEFQTFWQKLDFVGALLKGKECATQREAFSDFQKGGGKVQLGELTTLSRHQQRRETSFDNVPYK